MSIDDRREYWNVPKTEGIYVGTGLLDGYSLIFFHIKNAIINAKNAAIVCAKNIPLTPIAYEREIKQMNGSRIESKSMSVMASLGFSKALKNVPTKILNQLNK